MYKFIIFIFFLSSLNAYEFELTKKDKNYIQKSKNKQFIENRLKKYDDLKSKITNYSLIRKLSHVNSFLNKILAQKDYNSKGINDYWATPKEFLLQGHGDCEDYAIAKYFTLLELGINKKNLYFAIVKVKGEKYSHMVLLYSSNKNKIPLVLDNLSSKVIPFTKRKKLIPKIAFNEIDAYKFTKKRFTKKIKINWGKENKWETLLHRVYKLKE